MKNAPAAAVLVLLLSLTPLHAQQRFSETAQVTVVEVPVSVVGRDGNAVRNLTKDDFELYDDGRRVPIEFFDTIDMTKISAATEALPPAANRHFLLLFDVAHSSPGTIARASEAARQFVYAQLQERDLAAVAVFTAESGARIVTAFTRDRALLERAINTLGDAKYFRIRDPLMMSATAELKLEKPADTNDLAQQARDEAEAEATAEFRVMTARGRDSEQRNRIKAQTQNFGKIARMLDRIQGQKQVILLSEGFDARLVQGREELGFEKTREDTDYVFSGEVHKVDQEDRFGSSAASKDIGDMARLFRRSDVVLHAIDIRGLRANVDASSGAKRSSNESLFLMTTPTGGTVFQNANDLKSSFAKMLKQQEVVYVLGFTARGSGRPGRFHELKVKSKGGHASHRAGYYEPAAMSELERTLSIADIVASDAPIHDVDVALTAVPANDGVSITVEIPGSGAALTANLYLYAFDAQNQVADFLQQRIAVDLTNRAGVRYVAAFHLKPGDYAIKALVRVDETGRIGFVRKDVRVSDTPRP
jgi:VWFA-related protein